MIHIIAGVVKGWWEQGLASHELSECGAAIQIDLPAIKAVVIIIAKWADT